MKCTVINGLIAALSTSMLAACGGSRDSADASGGRMLATAAACYNAWNSTIAYNAGAQVSYNGVNYTAAYWTQGQNPAANNGPSGSGQPWISNGACGATPTPAPTPTPTPAPTPTPTGTWTTVLDGSEFNTNTSLWANFNNAYPWGSDHNGSARMYQANVWTNGGGVLELASWIITGNEGNSSSSPYLPIHYHSGTVYWKQQVTVNSSATQWTIEGDFSVPSVKGTWPAFWLTAVNGWPPELDILEFVGSATCRQNTFNGIYPNQTDISHRNSVSNPAAYHHYKVWLGQKNGTDVLVDYYIDGVWKAEDTATNYVGKPMWLILDLQMEGSSGSPGPTTNQYYYAKNLVIRKYK